MATFNVTVDDEILHGLFQGDEGMSRLVEQILNQVLDRTSSSCAL